MTINQRLDTLSEQVIKALQPSFIFIVSQEKIQHFPIREWANQQIKAEIISQLTEEYQSLSWHNYLVCYNEKLATALIIPKFESIRDLN